MTRRIRALALLAALLAGCGNDTSAVDGTDAADDRRGDGDAVEGDADAGTESSDEASAESEAEADALDGADEPGETPGDVADAPEEETGPSCGPDAVNARDRGVAGDGTTDDTAAIQALLDDAAVAAVYFPAGTYRIGLASDAEARALKIERDGVMLCGDGAASILKLADPGSSGRWVRAIHVTGDDVGLADFALDGSRVAGTGWEYEQEHGVFVTGDAARFHARGLEIHHFQGDGIFLYRAQDAVVEGNSIHDCWRAAINLEVGTRTRCSDNTIERCNSGVHIEMDTDGTVNADTQIRNNSIAPLQPDTGRGGTGIILNGRTDGLLRTVVELNTIDQSADPGPYSAILCATTRGAVIRANTIRGSVDPEHGILTAWYGNSDLTIEGNILEGCAANAPVLCGGATVATPNDGITVHENVARSSCTWSGTPYGDAYDGGFVWAVGAAPTTRLDAHDNVFE
jgi:hypothetical protein